MFKFIGVAVVIGGLAAGIAHYRGVVDLSFGAKVTPKGEQEMQELRNSAADAIRGVGEKAADSLKQPATNP